MLISWEALEEHTKALADNILKSGYKVDTLVAVVSSGMPTALLLSKMLGIKDICFIHVSLYNGNIKLPQLEVKSYLSNLQGKVVLVVDDICSSNQTLTKVKEVIAEQKPASIKTAVSIVSARACKTYPDFYGTALMREEDDWIEFPWDKYEKQASTSSQAITE